MVRHGEGPDSNVCTVDRKKGIYPLPGLTPGDKHTECDKFEMDIYTLPSACSLSIGHRGTSRATSP